jgi:hypothetical protein
MIEAQEQSKLEKDECLVLGLVLIAFVTCLVGFSKWVRGNPYGAAHPAFWRGRCRRKGFFSDLRRPPKSAKGQEYSEEVC